MKKRVRKSIQRHGTRAKGIIYIQRKKDNEFHKRWVQMDPSQSITRGHQTTAKTIIQNSRPNQKHHPKHPPTCCKITHNSNPTHLPPPSHPHPHPPSHHPINLLLLHAPSPNIKPQVLKLLRPLLLLLLLLLHLLHLLHLRRHDPPPANLSRPYRFCHVVADNLPSSPGMYHLLLPHHHLVLLCRLLRLNLLLAIGHLHLRVLSRRRRCQRLLLMICRDLLLL